MSYTTAEINKINATTSEFYSRVSESFSSTREHEWEGWNLCLKYLKDCNTVLDLGCGNRRFTKFLESNNINAEVDNIDNFAWDEKVRQIDIIISLLENSLNLKKYDCAVSFGVMHHIPSTELRFKLLDEITKSKIAIVSLWQFGKSERLFEKALSTTKVACDKLSIQNLSDNDYFLGWQDRTDVFRFCHNFTNNEIKTFENKYNVVEKFWADSEKSLNCYLIIKKKHA